MRCLRARPGHPDRGRRRGVEGSLGFQVHMKAILREAHMKGGVGCKGLRVLNKHILDVLGVAGEESSYQNFNSSQAVSNHTRRGVFPVQ